ncbi:MAG: hypothetical protein ACRDFB_07030 [Rhabdochlamydiaceae bacterium]
MSQPNETPSINDHLSKLKSIKYFVPARTIDEANMLLPKVDETIDNYVKALVPWQRDGDTIQHASDSLWDLARIAAVKADRNNTWDAAWDHAWKEASYSARDNYGWYGGGYVLGESARDAARDAAKYAARYIAYESALDKLQPTLPFRFVMDLYSM